MVNCMQIKNWLKELQQLPKDLVIKSTTIDQSLIIATVEHKSKG